MRANIQIGKIDRQSDRCTGGLVILLEGDDISTMSTCSPDPNDAINMAERAVFAMSNLLGSMLRSEDASEEIVNETLTIVLQAVTGAVSAGFNGGYHGEV